MTRWFAFFGLVFGFLGCAGGEVCVEPPAPDCTPLYPPTFDEIYTNTLSKSCSVGEGACHSSSGRSAGLSFGTHDEAYISLRGGLDAPVIPGEPECSMLMARLEMVGQVGQMPPGEPLSEGERCAIATWIRAGGPP